MSRDQVYAEPLPQVVDFTFNAAVADVFPDMIRRSVPGYETILTLLGVMGQTFIQSNTHVYDLGCSLGAATLALASRTQAEQVQFVGVDNSPAMVARCEQVLQRHLPRQPVTVLCADIRELSFEPASVIVLNFTLQFLPPADRQALLERLYQALVPNGVLILSEKLRFAEDSEQAFLTDLYMAFKRGNGYSELEISQKRNALEHVLIPETSAQHIERLQAIGFKQVYQWFQGLSFSSFIAVK
ncbi:carboxy-S-adenosyl-L-methionine synthase CmoA [Thiofilum flexile]|uniref:carboxy-S-adenosyl-L-methionine synthase CmoA n=1 Tax=Thiofilum flexile TaxID=125627 RepID=UPI000374FD53|nr:carboxy-S-adenosyl-L-methionine synthase CmoA [Thiofilum flexile]